MERTNLNKADWKKLIDFKIIDAEGNGFADTTEKIETIISITKNPTLIQVKQTVYSVQYVSGCFYPIWYKILSNPNKLTITKIKEKL